MPRGERGDELGAFSARAGHALDIGPCRRCGSETCIFEECRPADLCAACERGTKEPGRIACIACLTAWAEERANGQ